MRRHDVVPGLTTLLLAFAVANAPSAAAAPAAGADTARALRASSEPVDADRMRLRRAAAERRLGNARGVIDQLEPIDFTRPGFAGADRAAFLLGQAYLDLGSVERFVRLARAVALWERPGVYGAWLARRLATLESDGAPMAAPRPDSASATTAPGAPAASPALAPAGSALALALEARRLAAAGADDEAVLVALSTADTSSVLGRDLAGAALVRRAARRLARGEDAAELLRAVPAGSRDASTARHMLGLALIERGEAELGVAELEALLLEDSTYHARREVHLALAARAMDAGRWDEARLAYEVADDAWRRERDARLRLRDGATDTLWAAWRANEAASEALLLDAAAERAGAERLATAAADLDASPADAGPGMPVAADRGAPAPVPPPAPESWRAVAAAAVAERETGDRAARARADADRERARLADARRYFGTGLVQVRDEAAELGAHARWLDSLRANLDALDARLRAVRDRASAHLVARARGLLERCASHAVWIAAMEHLYLSGPHRERPLRVPAGYPGPDSLLAAERALTESIRALLASLATEWPDLVARSYAQAWRPGLIDRAGAKATEAAELLAGFRALEASIDARIASLAGSDSLRRLDARAARLGRAADSSATRHRALRDRVARAAIDRALDAMQSEREAIDYGLAAAAYALAVRRTLADSAGTASGPAEPAVMIASGSGRDSTRDATEDAGLDDPEAAGWRADAIPGLRAFLAVHPRSPVRADVRFRLADLLLVDARQRFRDDMARFVADQERGGAGHVALPVLDPAPALALYRAILAEDAGFEHRDAVLFNAGTLLADEGDLESDAFFQRLVAEHPESRYVAEANLRMGDLRFDARRFAESVPLYERAAQSRDGTLRAIALYKLGWAHFNGERFDDAADAFRSVLDVYDSTRAIAVQVDLQGEAESYLVHTLARAGGAAAFARHFDGAGTRRFERRVLRGLGHHFRRYSLFAEAAATERLYLERYPKDPDALASAERLIDTYRRWDRAAETRAARLECAPRFAPDSPWARAQASDSVRSAGAEFARAQWATVAFDHHRRARERGARDDWREAQRLYETLLATFPRDAGAPALELNAGEASARLGEHERALAHYGEAARTGVDSVASQALWQRVAVADAWYETTRPAAGASGGRVGRDSLARVVLKNADDLLARVPAHAQAGDVMWRQGHLALAHGWDERAAGDFGRLVEARPTDARTPAAAGLRADALFRLERFEDAGAAYEQAAAVAHRAGNDSLERRAREAAPVCAYRRAEAAVAADSSAHARHAELFEAVATRWPDYRHAALAQYRAGLASLAAGDRDRGVRGLWAVVRNFPRSDYVKDAYLQIARAEEAGGARERAADAYAGFADRYPDDESAGPAWLQAADLYEAAGAQGRADTLRLTYVRRRPADVETAMQVYEGLARRELKSVGPDRPVSSLLPAAPPAPRPTATRGKAAKKAAAPAAPAAPAQPASYLAEYVRRAGARPDLASKDLLAQVRFLEAEEARGPYLAARLTQPLEASLAIKQRRLDPLISRYRKVVDLGIAEWAHASTYRIGEALVAFGEALEASERPADLKGDDLAAYDEVIAQQSQNFYDRGEAVWTELLRPTASRTEDRWLALAQESLWKRMGARFAYLPSAEYPRVEAEAPERPKPVKAVQASTKKVKAAKPARTAKAAKTKKPAGGDASGQAAGSGGER